MENKNKLAMFGNMANGSISQDMLYEQAKSLLDTMLDFKELLLRYDCAIKEIKTKFDVLNKEFEVRYQRNPISSIHTRLKSQTSIMEKLSRLGLEMTRDNIEQNLHDIAGIRVICSYVDDIYSIADALIRQADITLISRKDYIKNPKPNGYRSLHLIVSVPIFFSNEVKTVLAEIQIRTIAMDFWASLEHQIKYKKNIKNSGEIAEQLRKCAEVIAYTDRMMKDIRTKIDNEQDEKTEEEIIFEKLKKFDINLG